MESNPITIMYLNVTVLCHHNYSNPLGMISKTKAESIATMNSLLAYN